LIGLHDSIEIFRVVCGRPRDGFKEFRFKNIWGRGQKIREVAGVGLDGIGAVQAAALQCGQ